MKRGTLTLAIAGMALALAVPTVNARAMTPAGSFQLAQAQGDDQADHGPSGPGMMHQNNGQDSKSNHDKHRQNGQRAQQMCETADAHHVASLAFSETRLKLTEAQKPAWTKVVEAATAAHQTMTKLMCADGKGKTAPANLPARLAQNEQMAQARLSHIQTLRPALEALYAVLTPEQQKIADTLPLGGGHGRGGHHGQQGW